MTKNGFIKELSRLAEAGVVKAETVENVRAYYSQSKKSNLPVIIFSVLGSLLIAAGIIQISAHNWDFLPRIVKGIISFCIVLPPLFLSAFAFLKKSNSIAWMEGSALLLSLCVAGSIGLIAQTFNVIPGEIPFPLLWAIIIVPIVLAMDSVSSAILLAAVSLWHYSEYSSDPESWMVFVFSGVIIYLLVKIFRQKQYIGSRLLLTALFVQWMFIIFARDDYHHPISDAVQGISFYSLCSLLYLLSFVRADLALSRFNFPTKVIPIAIIIVSLFPFSFSSNWSHIAQDSLFPNFGGDFSSIIFSLMMIFLPMVTAALAVLFFRKLKAEDFLPALFFIFFGIAAVCSHVLSVDVASALMNCIIVAFGLYYALRGAVRKEILLMNLGMLMLGTLIVMRFFDDSISLLVKGVVFLLTGLAFIGINVFILMRRADR